MKALKTYLTTNSIFSGTSGLLIIIFNKSFLMSYLNIEYSFILPSVGAILMMFSGFIFYVIQNKLESDILIQLISALDISWVVGSFAITFFCLFGIASGSHLAINLLAVWIGILAAGQLYYLNKRRAV